MRYIHNVSFHEKFIASGEYIFYEDEKPTGQIESWTKHQLPDGSYFVRVDHDARTTNDMSLLTEALQSADGEIERFDIHLFYSRKIDGVMSVRATYSVEGDYIQIGRFFNNDERVYSEVEVTEKMSLLPPGFIFLGAKLGADGVVVRPRFDRESDPAEKVMFGTTAMKEETIEVGSQTYSTRSFFWNDQKIWVDDHRVPLRIHYANSSKFIVLTGYTHST